MTSVNGLSVKDAQKQLAKFDIVKLKALYKAVHSEIAEDDDVVTKQNSRAYIAWFKEFDDEAWEEILEITKLVGGFFEFPTKANMKTGGKPAKSAPQFTRDVSLQHAEAMNKLLRNYAEENGLKWDPAGGSFSKNDFKFTGRLVRTGDDGENLLGKENWENYSSLYNLPKEWFGKTFPDKGQMLQIVGINTRRPKMPIDLLIVAGNKRGSKLKCSANFLRLHMS